MFGRYRAVYDKALGTAASAPDVVLEG
jgi:hypothetical protein